MSSYLLKCIYDFTFCESRGSGEEDQRERNRGVIRKLNNLDLSSGGVKALMEVYIGPDKLDGLFPFEAQMETALQRWRT